MVAQHSVKAIPLLHDVEDARRELYANFFGTTLLLFLILVAASSLFFVFFKLFLYFFDVLISYIRIECFKRMENGVSYMYVESERGREEMEEAREGDRRER